MPKYWGSVDLRGKFGTVVEMGGHEERWFILIEGRRVSFHRNHLATPDDEEWKEIP